MELTNLHVTLALLYLLAVQLAFIGFELVAWNALENPEGVKAWLDWLRTGVFLNSIRINLFTSSTGQPDLSEDAVQCARVYMASRCDRPSIGMPALGTDLTCSRLNECMNSVKHVASLAESIQYLKTWAELSVQLSSSPAFRLVGDSVQTRS